jgi:hypothetical protein
MYACACLVFKTLNDFAAACSCRLLDARRLMPNCQGVSAARMNRCPALGAVAPCSRVQLPNFAVAAENKMDGSASTLARGEQNNGANCKRENKERGTERFFLPRRPRVKDRFLPGKELPACHLPCWARWAVAMWHVIL